ncbi:4Fe-4S dicluster domain-containing protein [Thermoanaerobacterium sp. RBIITD]|uniref:4Fe-4S binding protein n=1 Tax=Thermoanaerobacterium sp. RBIITD TaxID=1550240 RepID=UPI000BB788C8|nr:4Fe-4S dicluster domain-containing protein [Thermoanaerobacterium sp. RBIITD]SNX54892.1 4Fe-4S dicluster domain-containing protein [Thermoanaerobacterium sp. RBIITD]
MAKRKIIKIDEEKCNGCGLCVTPCVESAITIENGKAKVISEELCDGAGVCLNVCPTNALSIEEREAVPFNEEAAIKHKNNINKDRCLYCGNTDDDAPIISFKYKGEIKHVCAKCLPQLIHG